MNMKSKVDALEAELLKLPQVALKMHHCRSGDIYARTMFIPAGTCVTGAVHKKDSMNVIYGDISTTTENGTSRLTGYNVLSTKAGNKRAVFAHTDTVWTTLCPIDLPETATLFDIEDSLVEESNKLQTRNPVLAVNTLLELT